MGVLIGATLPTVTRAAEEYLQAQRSAQEFFVDGQRIELEAYNINGNNYVKLRDIGEAVGFEVYWDGVAVQVLSGQPYAGEVPQAEDYSQEADPSIFTDTLTREFYNGMRDAVLHQEEILNGTYMPRSIKLETDSTEVYHVSSNFSNYPAFEPKLQPDGQYICDVWQSEAYAQAAEYTQDFIDSLSGLSDREKVERMVWHVADRITYEVAYSGPSKVLTQDGQVPGCCMAYAHSFMFLCNRAGIPCIFKVGDNHEWNMVYVDGQWWDVDVTSDDCESDMRFREYCTILWDPTDMEMAGFHGEHPEVTAFTQELLAPSSSK